MSATNIAGDDEGLNIERIIESHETLSAEESETNEEVDTS